MKKSCAASPSSIIHIVLHINTHKHRDAIYICAVVQAMTLPYPVYRISDVNMFQNVFNIAKLINRNLILRRRWLAYECQMNM